MHPSITLATPALRANAIAWNAYCGRPIWAVVKANGYSWGAARIAGALDDLVAGYYVADSQEFFALRRHTRRPIAVFADVPAADLGALLDAQGIPNISSEAVARAAAAWALARGRRALIRVGLSAAVGWSGIRPEAAPALAGAMRGAPLDVALWTHLTDRGLAAMQTEALAGVVAIFREAGAAVVSSDCESTASTAWHGGRLLGSHARIGVGLFGSRGDASLGPQVSCALRVTAPVCRRSVSEPGRTIGYGALEVEPGQELLTLRCGYGDGFPRARARSGKILAVGMQYTTILADNAQSDFSFPLVDDATDLDALAERANCLPHEIVVALGVHSAARARLFNG